ncbi:putative NADH:ubiquinone oxidoreductase, chain I [Candidatus Zinderia insecticola CARI]|uniref:NADH-quinone oxidoreductase subunit I n=1 Tax=Zinderia insecticola (strain CARI) TaxID=871271 RepID=E0TIU1_ZINIC|nr:putative NADH:ubiquinone oxidoreductase, chain I [Candidatus Zinderia insecticola CARI]
MNNIIKFYIFLKKKILNLFLIDILKALNITKYFLFSKKITNKYPIEKIPISKKFRGLHALRIYNNKKSRCISCKLCESVCPANAINIKTGYNKKNNIRETIEYKINLKKCIFCGLCESSCPVNSIVEFNFFEYCFFNKNKMILNKKKLYYIEKKYKKKIFNKYK